MIEKALFDEQVLNFMIDIRKELKKNPEAFKGKPIREMIIKKFPDKKEDDLFLLWWNSRKSRLVELYNFMWCQELRKQDKSLREISEETKLPLSYVYRLLKEANKVEYPTQEDIALWLGMTPRGMRKAREKGIDFDAYLKSCFKKTELVTLIGVVKRK